MPAKKKPVQAKHAATPLQQITEFKQTLAATESKLEGVCEKAVYDCTQSVAKMKEKLLGAKEKLTTQKAALKEAKAQHKAKPGKQTEKRVAKAKETIEAIV